MSESILEQPGLGVNTSVQDRFLSQAQKKQIHVAIHLANGLKLVGYVLDSDTTSILFSSKDDAVPDLTGQLVFKCNITTVLPTRDSERGLAPYRGGRSNG